MIYGVYNRSVWSAVLYVLYTVLYTVYCIRYTVYGLCILTMDYGRPSGSFDQVEAAAPHACGPTDEPLAAVAAVAAVAPSLPDEAWFVNVTYLQTPDCKT